MDAFRTVVMIALILSYGDFSNQLLEEDKDIKEITPTTTSTTTVQNYINEVTNATTDIDSKNCTTGKGAPGGCVKRAYCEYGTSAIDFTLYAPREYINLCEGDEVCCPPSATLLMERTTTGINENSFEFDDDD